MKTKKLILIGIVLSMISLSSCTNRNTEAKKSEKYLKQSLLNAINLDIAENILWTDKIQELKTNRTTESWLLGELSYLSYSGRIDKFKSEYKSLIKSIKDKSNSYITIDSTMRKYKYNLLNSKDYKAYNKINNDLNNKSKLSNTQLTLYKWIVYNSRKTVNTDLESKGGKYKLLAAYIKGGKLTIPINLLGSLIDNYNNVSNFNYELKLYPSGIIDTKKHKLHFKDSYGTGYKCIIIYSIDENYIYDWHLKQL